MNKLPALQKRKKKSLGLTLVELMFAIVIAAPIVLSLTLTLILTLRTQATYGEQAIIRDTTDSVLNRLAQDIRNTSSSGYNSDEWQSPTRALTGITWTRDVDTGEDGPPLVAQDNQMVLRLIDTANGRSIIWTYDRAQNTLTRQTQDLRNVAAPLVTTNFAQLSFSDLTFREIRQSQIDSALGGDETSNSITAIHILGRTLSRITRINTVNVEVDGNNDGDIRDDALGAAFFGRTDEGDNPSFQYFYNFEVAFRNT